MKGRKPLQFELFFNATAVSGCLECRLLFHCFSQQDLKGSVFLFVDAHVLLMPLV
jgi:hypothetical protein